MGNKAILALVEIKAGLKLSLAMQTLTMLLPCSNHYSLCTLVDAYNFATEGQNDSFYKVWINYLGRQGWAGIL